MHFSKSKYCGFCQCPKKAWLTKYKPEVEVIPEDLEARFEAGHEVGELAKGLFGDYVDVTVRDGEKLDIKKMLENTKAEVEKGTDVICEAAFSYDGLYCACDLLKKDADGWSIYEVKSSTDGEKEVYIQDLSYQRYVLENCGLKINKTYTVVVNNEYVFEDKLDIHEFFKITDMTDAVLEEYPNVEPNLKEAEEILAMKEEPDMGLSECCHKPYDCSFFEYCSRDLPTPSVFDLYRMIYSKKIKFYNQGIVSFDELKNYPDMLNDKQNRQIDYNLNDYGLYADPERISEFLDTLSYPLYFLDFETMQMVIPKYNGTKPYQQITFQYSLHYIEEEGGELKHKEFLAESGPDPRRALAERLCEDIPMDVCTTAYNKSFECNRIKELAEAFPDLSEHLLNIRDNIVDLLVPFSNGWMYNKEMGGSFSIKSVLPALFPNDPELDYHNLDQVHHGGEAMAIFPAIEHMSPEERERARHNLLKYCELDTYAMVKV